MSIPQAELGWARWHGHQRRIGLTGGIATGKSAVGRLLAPRGLPVLDADADAREALAPGRPATVAVLKRHGSRVRAERDQATAGDIDAPGATDRAALGRIVFSDPAERHWLEQLLHQLVRECFDAELTAHQRAPVAVLMIPLLFEASLEPLCSEVWVVSRYETQQRERLRRLWKTQSFRAIMEP